MIPRGVPGRKARLAAPRRYGKMSLLAAHIAGMRAVGHRAVLVDLSQVTTTGDVAARVARAWAELPGDPRRTFDRLLSRLGLKLGVAGLTLSVSGRPAAHEPERARGRRDAGRSRALGHSASRARSRRASLMA
jgi:uncharacterized protein